MKAECTNKDKAYALLSSDLEAVQAECSFKAVLLEEFQREKVQQMIRCNSFENTCSQLRLEVSQQKESYEAELASLKAEVDRLNLALSAQAWDKAAELAPMRESLKVATTSLAVKDHEIKDLCTQLVAREQAVQDLQEQIDYQL